MSKSYYTLVGVLQGHAFVLSPYYAAHYALGRPDVHIINGAAIPLYESIQEQQMLGRAYTEMLLRRWYGDTVTVYEVKLDGVPSPADVGHICALVEIEHQKGAK